MSFLSKIFGAKKNHSAIVINDSFLEALQIIRKGEKLKLVGASHISLEEGVAENGELKNRNRFQEALKELFDGAQPKLINSDHFFVNIPFEQVFTFVKTYSKHTKEDHIKKDMEEFIQNNSPFSAEDLTIEYQQKNNDKIVYSALAYSKMWEKSITEIFAGIGIDKLYFVPEPIAQMSLAGKNTEGNFILLSLQSEKIYLSSFYDGVLYDCYMTEASDIKNPDVITDEFNKASEDFYANFNEPIQDVYLADFPPSFKNDLIKAIDNKELAFSSLEKNDTKLADFISPEDHSSTLFGLSDKEFDV